MAGSGDNAAVAAAGGGAGSRYLGRSGDSAVARRATGAIETHAWRDGRTVTVRARLRALPLLSGITAQTIARVAGEEQILVFAERINCLRQLAATLRERHGVETHVADGTVDETTFGRLKHAFQGGEFPVFCLGPVAREGHNFQKRELPGPLDLPWHPRGLSRVGFDRRSC